MEESDITTAPCHTKLIGNDPNPFNPSTVIKYSIKEKTPINIKIYDVKERLVKKLLGMVNR